jgi:hypothetical protein
VFEGGGVNKVGVSFDRAESLGLNPYGG